MHAMFQRVSFYCFWLFVGVFRKLRLSFFVVLCGSMFLLFQPVKGEERAIDHAPIGVVGDHYHKKGDLMVSVRYMQMFMKGNLYETQGLSDQEVLEIPNPYSMGEMSSKLSVVPQNMTMRMTMLGAMYAPSNTFTLMGMAGFMTKHMDLDTYQGMMPMGIGAMNRKLLGSFSTSTSDISKLSISGLVKFYEQGSSRLHAHIGLESSVGSNDVTAPVLTPMNIEKEMILPYGMQIGDKSTSLLSGFTYVRKADTGVYGGQLMVRNPIYKRSWNFGAKFSATGWVQRELIRKTSISFRTTYHSQASIQGRDPRIIAPVQTANPSNYGGKIMELGFGLNQLFKILPGEYSDRIGIETSYPFYQNLDGLQMNPGLTVTVGFQKSVF